MQTLYQVDNKKQLRTWKIWVEGFTIIIEHGLARGKKVRQTEVVVTNKSGRTIDEQIAHRIASRVHNQMAKGYRESIEEASNNAGKNQFGFVKPMLAQQINKQKSIDTTGAVLQRKLDGNRMLVTRQEGELIAYSRNGKIVSNMEHILEQLGWVEEGMTIDGEVYRHGMQLKDIRGAVAKRQSSTSTLNYHIYDVVDDKPFKERFLTNILSTPEQVEFNTGDIIIEPWWDVDSEEHTKQLFNQVRGEGYEGLIMRLDGYGYEIGKRSKGLLKIKHRYDAEYEVIDVEVGKDGIGILVMRLPNGETVKGVAPGTKLDKVDVAQSPENYIGRMCTCSFAYLTEFGVPFHLTCDNWRN